MHHRANAPISLPPAMRGIAQRISDHLMDDEPGAEGRPYLVLPRGERVDLPSEAVLLLRDLFAALAEGQAVSIVPVHKKLTTQEAADLLNTSRQGLVDLKEQRDKEREQALRELTQAGEDLGDYYGGD